MLGVGGTLLVQYIAGPKQNVNVTGQGIVEAQADQATITVNVSTSSWSQEQAEKDNKQEVQGLKDSLLKLGVPESRITISNNEFFPMMQDQPMPVSNTAEQGMMGVKMPINNQDTFYANTSLTLILDSLKGIDSILASIKDSPHAKVTSTNYSLKSTAPYQSQAREKALQDARNQAEAIAKINKLHVGKLLYVSDNGYSLPVNSDMGMKAGGPSAGPNGVVYGEKTIEVTASFSTQYELY